MWFIYLVRESSIVTYKNLHVSSLLSKPSIKQLFTSTLALETHHTHLNSSRSCGILTIKTCAYWIACTLVVNLFQSGNEGTNAYWIPEKKKKKVFASPQGQAFIEFFFGFFFFFLFLPFSTTTHSFFFFLFISQKDVSSNCFRKFRVW